MSAPAKPFAPTPYRPRETAFIGVGDYGGWRLKRYAIRRPGDSIDRARFEEGFKEALDALPRPATTPSRPGVGFVIFHPGAAMLYVVLCWWENENELVIHTFVTERAPGAEWRDGGDDYSFCVWDLEVIWAERRLYVETVLRESGPPDIEGYLSRSFEPSAPETNT
ncbi:MAG: isochorismatase [Parvularculaceae bacterium]